MNRRCPQKFRSLKLQLLEDRRMLAQLLPDMFAWANPGRGYLHDAHVEGNLLRFTTALANQGEGDLENAKSVELPVR